MAKGNKYSIPGVNAWLLWHQMTLAFMKYEESEFKKIGLTPSQFHIIALTKYLPPPVTPTDIKKWTGRNLNTITLTIDRMEKAGLIKKKRDLPDRRALRLILTTKSKKFLPKATKLFKKIPHELMSCLSDDELQTHVVLTQKLRGELYKTIKSQNGEIELYLHRVYIMNSVMHNKSLIKPEDVDLP